MKITIFLIVLVLKSNENVEIWYFKLSQRANSSEPFENSLFEDVFKVSAPSFHTSSKSFDKAQYGLVDGVLWQIIPYCLQDFLQLVDGIWLGLKCLVAFKHSSPYVVVKRIKGRWVRGPFVFSYEVTAVGGNPVFSQLCEQVLRPARVWNQMAKATWNLQPIWVTGFHSNFTIYFCLVQNEMQSSTPAETMMCVTRCI